MTVSSLRGLRDTTEKPLPREANHPSRPANRPARVLYIINDLSIGGAEMMLYKLLAETDRTRFRPVVISLMRHAALSKRIEALGIEVHSTMMRAGTPTPLGLWRLVRLMRRLNPDLIVGWMYHSCFAAHLAKIFFFKRAPIVWSIHYSISSLEKEKWITAATIRVCAFLSRFPAQMIFVSQAAQRQHKSLGYPLEKSCVIPNGIDLTEFVPSADARLSVRSELGLPESAFLIGLVGRYHPMKDHSTFLRAAALLSKEHPDAQFVLIGRRVNRENRKLREMIEQLGLAARTHLLSERHDLPRLVAALDVFSLSSSYGESFPNVIGEAMACGVPCVVTDVGDAAWMVENAGRVVPPREPDALAAAWQEMIELGAEGRQALGQSGRLRVSEHFTLKSVAARYDALYENVLAQESPEEFPSRAPGAITSLSNTLEQTGAQ